MLCPKQVEELSREMDLGMKKNTAVESSQYTGEPKATASSLWLEVL